MTGRERLTAASRGGAVDRKPVLVWGRDSQADGMIASSPREAVQFLAESPESLVLVEVLSPLGHELAEPRSLLDLLHDDPSQGEALLSDRAAQTRTSIQEALEAGADGVAYRLAGAMPSVTTPMQYGGHFLEVDREILSDLAEARFVLLYVEGQEEPYLDFVIDLPAHAFGWDYASGIPPAAIRSAREGALAGAHPEADILLAHNFSQASAWIPSEEAAAS